MYYKKFHFTPIIDITIIEDSSFFDILPVIHLSKLFGINSLDFRFGTFEISFHSKFNDDKLVKTINETSKKI